ncbi:uncharacterized protein BJX67DRAFT_360427 [Aspergillus lucknowensis]|uniref:Uncharacterized protein n=1 Tax=Aspergillus lucknowensis TaxID=176173 RepID=A0ABR4LJD3_9EURO
MGAQVPTFPFQPQPALTAAPSFPGWNCTSTVAPGTFGPYQPGCFASSSGVGTQWPSIPQASPLPQAAQIPQPPQLPQLSQMPRLPHASPTIGSQPGYNQQFVPSYFQEAIYQKSLEDATKQYDAISEQLSQIDRFTAMHAWVIDPDTKKALVEQRKSLVRELDTVRLYKEHLQVLFGKSQTGNTSGLQKEASPAPVTPSRKGGWESPSKSKSRSLSPTVRNLYRTIEETDERGEPIDGLLHALSGASKGLAKRLTEERANSLAVPSMEVSREVINSTFAMAREEPPRKAPEKGEYVHPVQVSRRLWQSDPHPHSPLLSQCFNKDWSPVLQKSAAPAVSQNVTAHAFLQSFDGAGKTSDDFELV